MKLTSRVFLIAALLCCSLSWSFGQQKKNIQYSGLFDTYYFRGPLSVDVGAGVPMMFGDLCSGFGCKKIRPATSLGLSYRWWPRIAFGGNFSFILMAGEDNNEGRDITFKTSLFEISAFAKFFILEKSVRRHSDMKKADFPVKPYITVGLGSALYSVKTENAADEGVAYPRVSGMFPTALGAQYRISKRVALSAEASYRWILSDYIDGVSTVNGNDGKSDSYMTIEVKLNWSPFAPREHKKPIVVEPKEGGTGGDSDGDAPAEETNDGGYGNDTGGDDSPSESVDDAPAEEEESYEEEPAYEEETEEEVSDEDEYYDGSDDEEEEDTSDEEDGWGDDGW